MSKEISPKNYLERLLKQAAAVLKIAPAGAVFPVAIPEARFGDYSSNIALVSAKFTKKDPQDLAPEIITKLKELDTEKRFAEISSLGGFINFRLSTKTLGQNLRLIFKEKNTYGSSSLGRGKTAVVEYFQLNTAKQPHVGHMSSAILGDAIKRLVKFQGYKVLSDTHVGDWGTQFGLLIAAYKKWGNKKVIEADPLEELEKLYVEYNRAMEKDPGLREVGKQEFAKLEAGDPENRKLWEWFNRVSMRKLHSMSKLLALEKFELHLGESFYEDKMAAVLDELRRKNLVSDIDGALRVDLEPYRLDQAILKKSDGASTYLMRDLAKLKYFWEKYSFTLNVYVVDVRQSLHFRQLFQIAALAGWTGAEKSFHVAYGFMKLPEGMLSTRSGNVVALEKVIAESAARAQKIIEEKNPKLAGKQKIASSVGLAALKYFVLSHSPKSDITFVWDKALSFEGDTGPYLQYTHARVKSILRKAGKFSVSKTVKIPESPNEAEQFLLSKLEKFSTAAERAAAEFSPNLVCVFLFDLAQSINRFYERSQVLKEKDPVSRAFRLALVSASAQVLKNGLNLLGMEAPEEM